MDGAARNRKAWCAHLSKVPGQTAPVSCDVIHKAHVGVAVLRAAGLGSWGPSRTFTARPVFTACPGVHGSSLRSQFVRASASSSGGLGPARAGPRRSPTQRRLVARGPAPGRGRALLPAQPPALARRCWALGGQRSTSVALPRLLPERFRVSAFALARRVRVVGAEDLAQGVADLTDRARSPPAPRASGRGGSAVAARAVLYAAERVGGRVRVALGPHAPRALDLARSIVRVEPVELDLRARRPRP